MSTIREENEQLQQNIHQFMRTVRMFSDEQFTEPVNGWAARDVVAHLIGWTLACVDGADAFARGEPPSVLIDPGEDFADVNAMFVAKYDATDMNEILRELELSYQELARKLFTVDNATWTRPVQVPGWNSTTTLEQNIQAISGDFVDHRRELAEWLQFTATN